MIEVKQPLSVAKFATEIGRVLASQGEVSVTDALANFKISPTEGSSFRVDGTVGDQAFNFLITGGKDLRVVGTIDGSPVRSQEQLRGVLEKLSPRIEEHHADQFAHSSVLRSSAYLQLLARDGRGESLLQPQDAPYAILDAVLTEAARDQISSGSRNSTINHKLSRGDNGEIQVRMEFPYNRGEEFAFNTFKFMRSGEISHNPPFADMTPLTDRHLLLSEASALLRGVFGLERD